MRVRVGTSGYQYRAWRGSFYSEDCKEADMLTEYAQRLDTVEINSTFYRMPKRSVLERWAQQVPDGFALTLKASRRISHRQRLKESAETLAILFENAAALGDKLGAVLFQLPPNMKKDLPRLADFLKLLPVDSWPAFEFRHPSWFAQDVFSVLRDHNAALCIADVDGQAEAFVATADWGYLRLRRDAYPAAELSAMAARIREQPWGEVYAYFKHEQGGPALAAELSELLGRP